VATGRATSHSVRGFFGDGRIPVSDYLSSCRAARMEGGFCVDSSAYYRTDGVGPAEAAYGRLVSERSELRRRRART
jgi:hypothetical protein